MIKVGKKYRFTYDELKNVWECVSIKNDWATLIRMSKDHAGKPRMVSTSIEVDSEYLIEVNSEKLSLGISKTPGDTYHFTFSPHPKSIGEVHIHVENSKIISVEYENFA